MKRVVKTPKTIEKVVEKVTVETEEIIDTEGGYITCLGKYVYIICDSYAYAGNLTGLNASTLELSDPHIVYETGPFFNKTWKDAQKLPTNLHHISLAKIESMCVVKR